MCDISIRCVCWHAHELVKVSMRVVVCPCVSLRVKRGVSRFTVMGTEQTMFARTRGVVNVCQSVVVCGKNMFHARAHTCARKTVRKLALS